MNARIDLEPLLDHIEHNVMPVWVVRKDQRRERLAKGEPLTSHVVKALDNIIDILNNILESFYEKEYKKGLEYYIEWLLKEGYPMTHEDLEMLITYGKYFGIDAAKLEELRTAYKLPEK